MYYRFRNVNDAYHKLRQVFDPDVVDYNPSRGGECYEQHAPTMFMFAKPNERVLFDDYRDANPFFHLFESLWMLAGKNEVKMLKHYVKDFGRFANADGVMPGAYGARWRWAFGFDQIEAAIDLLKKEPDTRRAVVGMFCPEPDLKKAATSPDVPCNLAIQFSRRRDPCCLDMYVFNRSNDLIWGALGANAVHMTVLQEFMAERVGTLVGNYHVLTSNLHVYEETVNRHPMPTPTLYDPYREGDVHHHPMRSTQRYWMNDLHHFVGQGYAEPPVRYATWFFHGTVLPASQAWNAHKEGDYELAGRKCMLIQCTDWRYAMTMWIAKRKLARKETISEDEATSA